MKQVKKELLKEYKYEYYFRRLILTYLQPLKWEEAIRESTENGDCEGILNYRNLPVINRKMEFDVLDIKDTSSTNEFNYRSRRRKMARVFSNQYLEELEKVIRLELPNISEEELIQIATQVRNLQSRNAVTIEKINFEMLQPKYKRLFDENQFAHIIKYPYIQDFLVALDDNELKLFEIAFKSYLERENSIIESPNQSEWNFKMEEYIASLISGQYEQVILEILQLKKEQEKEEGYRLLGYILDKPNYYNIQSIEDLKNLEEKKKKYLNKL